MTDARPPMKVELAWNGDLRFTGRAGAHEVGVDGSASTTVSPTQMLALSLSGCMAIDLVHILQKGRHALTALHARFTGERAAEEPKRFTRIRLHFTLATDAPAERVQRAIDLSREKYCSVWNSMRQDIELAVTFDITPAS